jgi:hypothetical protein
MVQTSQKGHAPENITKLALSPLLALTRTSISVEMDCSVNVKTVD